MRAEGVVTMFVVVTFCQSVAKQRVYCLNVGANSGGHQCLCIYPACYEYASSSSSSSSFSCCSLTALPPFFSLFVLLLTCSHTLLTHHTLTHSYRSYVVHFCFNPPTRPWFRLQRSFGFGFICANVSSTCAQRSGQL